MGCSAATQTALAATPHTCHHPMMVVHVKDVLQMRGRLKCHQELLALGQIHEYHPSFFTIFVSHQWLGGGHPDLHGNQFRNLQKALRKVIDGSIRLELDMTAQFLGHQKTLTAADRHRLNDAYVWFDWFSVPQASVETDELQEEVQRKANLCIRSIPAYVDACQMFVALVPRMVNEKQENLDYFSWLSRGWCRAEMWCKLLSEKSDFPIIVVSAMDEVRFFMPVQWLDCPIHAGVFSYDRDRQEVCNFIKAALHFKLERLSQRKNLNLFRYYAARYEDFLGLPSPSRTKADFFSYFRFDSEEVTLRQKGMCALACAALSADVALVRELVAMKAPLNSTLPALVEVDVLPDWTPLHLAAAHSTSAGGMETMAALLELRSDPNATNRLGHPLVGTCNSAAGVELLVKHAADVNKLSPPTMASALVLASLRCASEDTIQKFIELKADVNLVKGGLGLAPLHSLAINASINPHSLAVAELLIQARPDPDLPVRAGALFRSIELVSRATLRLRKESPGIVWVFGEGSTTPLGYAAMFGSQDLVDFLLDQHADPTSKNHRGHTPLQLARSSNVVQVISHRTSGASSARNSSDASSGPSADKSMLPAGVASPASPWFRLETPQETADEGHQFLGSGAVGSYALDDSIGFRGPGTETILSIGRAETILSL